MMVKIHQNNFGQRNYQEKNYEIIREQKKTFGLGHINKHAKQECENTKEIIQTMNKYCKYTMNDCLTKLSNIYNILIE